MKPAVKYAAVAALYRSDTSGIWEHQIFQRLLSVYPRHQLRALREDLISLSTVGWLVIVEEVEYRGQLLRRYALGEHIRPFVRFQLNVDRLIADLGWDSVGDAASSGAPVSAGDAR